MISALVVLLLSCTAAELHAQRTTASQFVLRVSAANAEEVAARNGLTIVRQIDGQDLFLVTKTSSPLPVSALTADGSVSSTGNITSDPEILSIEPNAVVATPESQSPDLNGSVVSILDGAGTLVDYFNNQVWSRYVDQPATAAIGLAAGRATSGTGGGIVAVIDTGVDPTHPALAGSLVAGYDFIHETEGIASEWSDVDGSVVSILDGSVVSILDGQQVVTVNGSTVAILDQATASAIDTSLLPRSFGHGTMVAGLVHLVAPTARIMPLKAFQADGTSTVFDVVRAIYYAMDHGARVINMSFSAATASPEITRAINIATNRGIICVASAGNLGTETLVYPGALRNVLGVGSTTSTMPPIRSSFSNYGDSLVSLGAPGEAVITTYPGGHYAAAWGTSFSAPLVAGSAALLLQVDPTVDQQKAADVLGKAQFMDAGMGRGRLNLAEAVQTVHDAIPPTVTLTAPTSGGSVFGSVLVSANAYDNVAVSSVQLQLDGNAIGPEITSAPFERSWNTASVSNGNHVLTAIAHDAAGNVSSSVINVTVTNDTEAPAIALTTPVDSTVVTGTVAVLAAATDDIGVAGVQFTIDGQPAGPEVDAAPYQLVWNTWDLANGSHTISARARDAAGHVAETSVSIVVTNDHVPPSVAIELIPGVTVSGMLPIVATASDDIGVAGVQLLLDDSPMSGELAGAPYELVWDTAQVANGNHVITAIARDAAGHQTTTSVAVTVDNSGIGNDLLTQ